VISVSLLLTPADAPGAGGGVDFWFGFCFY
jgi:hypothetical protein